MLVQQEEEADARKINPDILRILLEGALKDGLENDYLPAPGLLDVIETMGLYDIRPQTLSLQALLDFVDPKRQIQDVSNLAIDCWIHNIDAHDQLGDVATSWYEDTAETRALLQSDKNDEVIAKELWAFLEILETRRDIWARRFLQTALIMNPKANLSARQLLTASAFRLMSGHSIRDNTLMNGVAVSTVSVAGLEHMGF